MWGGVFSPLIPMLDDEAAVDRAIAAWNVDVLAPVVLSPDSEAVDADAVAAASRLVDRHPHLRWPSRVDHLGLFAPIGENAELAVVDVQHVVDHLWQDSYRYTESSDWRFPLWSENDSLSPLFACSFGDFGDGPIAARLRRAYRNGLRAEEIRIEEQLGQEVASFRVPIQLTAVELRRLRSIRRGDGIYLGDPADACDLRRFWNLRAQGRKITFLPNTADAERVLPYLGARLERLPPQDFDAWGTVWRSTQWEPDDELPEFLARVVPEGMLVLRDFVDESRTRSDERRRGNFAADDETVLATVEDSPWRTRMVCSLPHNPFARSRLSPFFSHWAVSLQPRSEYAYRPKTLHLPGVPDLNGWAAREMTANTRDVRLQRESLDLIVNATEAGLDVGLLDQAEIVRKMLERAGITAEPSGAGEVVERIVRQMEDSRDAGSFAHLGRVRF
jgi:hypothetical protein